MITNRLKLDWKLESRNERATFVKTYLSRLAFVDTLTPHELETLSNYILWGKNSQGLNGRQEGIELETRYGTWDAQKVESLDALLESPTFSDSMLRRPTDPIYKLPKMLFSREEARKYAPQYILDEFEILWRQIDEYEVLVGYYELAHNRRVTELRPSLLSRFDPSELDVLRSRAEKMANGRYLQYKRELVELRRQQYTLKDSYAEPMLTMPTFNCYEDAQKDLDEMVNIAPMAIPNDKDFRKKVFNCARPPEPKDFSEEDLRDLSKLLWLPREYDITFDFGDDKHLYKFLDMLDAILQDNEDENSTFRILEEILRCYIGLAKLKPHQRRVLELKLEHKTNQDIADIINKEYGHKYTLNYISTMYCKTILPAVADAAKYHREVCENIFFPENFKTCLDCGKSLLKIDYNFMKKAKVKDGFSPRCKECERLKRLSKKE